MSHFAQIDENNVVVNITVIPDEYTANGQEYINANGLSGTWLETSLHTLNDVFLSAAAKTLFINSGPASGTTIVTPAVTGRAFRYTYARIGYIYDSIRDAFIPPKPFPSWSVTEVYDTSTLWGKFCVPIYSPLEYTGLPSAFPALYSFPPVEYPGSFTTESLPQYTWNESLSTWTLLPLSAFTLSGSSFTIRSTTYSASSGIN